MKRLLTGTVLAALALVALASLVGTVRSLLVADVLAVTVTGKLNHSGFAPMRVVDAKGNLTSVKQHANVDANGVTLVVNIARGNLSLICRWPPTRFGFGLSEEMQRLATNRLLWVTMDGDLGRTAELPAGTNQTRAGVTALGLNAGFSWKNAAGAADVWSPDLAFVVPLPLVFAVSAGVLAWWGWRRRRRSRLRGFDVEGHMTQPAEPSVDALGRPPAGP